MLTIQVTIQMSLHVHCCTLSCCFAKVTLIVGVADRPTLFSIQFNDKLSELARGLIGILPVHKGIPSLVQRDI